MTANIPTTALPSSTTATTVFDWVSSYTAATPLETCIAHALVECPVEVDTSGKSILVTLDLGGTQYEYTLR